MTAIDRFRSDPRVQDVTDERWTDDGIWIHLKSGFADHDHDPLQPVHAIHEWTVGDAAMRLRGVKPCNCRECIADKARNARVKP